MDMQGIIEAAQAAGFDVNVQQAGDVVRVFVTDKSSSTVTEFTGTVSGEPLPDVMPLGDPADTTPEPNAPLPEPPLLLAPVHVYDDTLEGVVIHETQEPTPVEPPAPTPEV
jgi:hypothetical protein